MKKFIFSLVFFFFLGSFIYSQQNDSILLDTKKIEGNIIDSIQQKSTHLSTKTSYWSIEGKHSVTLSQNTYSKWISGGSNMLGINARANYNINYRKKNIFWANRVVLGYGLLSNQGEKTKKTDDEISIKSTYGKKIYKNWYSTASLAFFTQIANGYDYVANPDYTSKDRNSSFMSPAYATFGIGADYKPNDKFDFTFKPLSVKAIFVLDKKLQTKGNYGLKNEGDSYFLEWGGIVGANYKNEIFTNVFLDNTVSLFFNYFDHIERVAIGNNTYIDMKINKYLSTIFTLDLLYDHNIKRAVQLKQTLGVGLLYNFKTKL